MVTGTGISKLGQWGLLVVAALVVAPALGFQASAKDSEPMPLPVASGASETGLPSFSYLGLGALMLLETIRKLAQSPNKT